MTEKFYRGFVEEGSRISSSRGSIWTRIEKDQAGLIESASSLSSHPGIQTNEALRWLRDGRSKPVFDAAFKFSEEDIQLHGPDRWGYYSGSTGLNLSSYLEGPPVLTNRTGHDYHLVSSLGERVTLRHGESFISDPHDDQNIIRVTGRIALLPGGVMLTPEVVDAPDLLSTFGPSRVVGLREDIVTESKIGLVESFRPLPLGNNQLFLSNTKGTLLFFGDSDQDSLEEDIPTYTISFEAKNGGYTNQDGVYFHSLSDSVWNHSVFGAEVPEAGKRLPDNFLSVNYGATFDFSPSSFLGSVILFESTQTQISDEAAETAANQTSAQSYLIPAPHSMWILRLKEGYKPYALKTKKGTLVSGTGFMNGPGCIYLFEDPWTLWPDGVCLMSAAEIESSHSRMHPLRTQISGAGKGVSLYRRRLQNPAVLFRAACEVIGLPVAGENMILSGFEYHAPYTLMRFRNGESKVVKGQCLRKVGDMIFSGEEISGMLSLRSENTHGPGWYRNRPWGLRGIPARSIFSWAPEDLVVKDTPSLATSYQDASTGDLRARISLIGSKASQDLFWETIEKSERLSGRSLAKDLLNFSSAGQQVLVNPLEVFLHAAGVWAFAIEGALGSIEPEDWRRIEDFILESKPAGSLVIVGPTYFY